jgi:hypothetical protein
MNTRLTSLAQVVLSLSLCLAMAQAPAQTQQEQALKELSRDVPAGTLQACSLITRADVVKATGRDPYVDPEAAGKGGWMCNVGTGELKVYSGPKSLETWESTLKQFKMDKEPRTPAPNFGANAYFMYPKPTSKYVSNAGVLVAQKSSHTLVLSLDAAEGQPGESVRPALESLMKTVLSRVP